MCKNKVLLLALVAIGSISACSGKASPVLALSPNMEPDRLAPVFANPNVPTAESETVVKEEAAYSNDFLLSRRVIGVEVDINKKDPSKSVFGSDTIRVLPKALQSGQVTFKSNDETIATVDENGVVTAVNEGRTSVEVSDKLHPEVKATVPVYVYPVVATRKGNTILAAMQEVSDTENLREIVDHEIYEKTKYKVVNDQRVMQLYACWNQNSVCSYDDAYFRIYETDADIVTENGSITYKDYQWLFYTNPQYDTYVYHQVGDVKTYYPVSMVAYMDENKERYVPMFDILDNLFTSGREVFTNIFENASLEGFLDFARNDYSNVKKHASASFGDGTFFLDCTYTPSKVTVADIDDEQRYGIPYGTQMPATYDFRFIVDDNKIVGFSNHVLKTYSFGGDDYVEEYNIDHFYERITDENRDSFIYVPDKSDYTLVDYLFAI